MNPYSNNKIFHHMDRVIDLKQKGHAAPVHVYFVVSDVCNHDCSFCLYRMSGEISSQMFDNRRMMPTERAFSLLGEFKQLGIRAVQFTGGGEPTVHPDFVRLFYRANFLGLDTGLVTNGQRMNEEVRKELLNAVWLRLSLDAGVDSTYALIRNVSESAYHKVLNNLRELTAEVARSNSKLTVGVSFIITRESWAEIVRATRIVRDLGAAYIRFATRNSYPQGFSYYDGIVEGVQDMLDLAKEYQTDSFRVYDTFDERLADLEQGHPDYSYCMQQRLSTYVGADLNVYRCCVTAYNGQYGLIGSVMDQTMSELWNGEEGKRKLAGLDAKTCPRCQFNIRNRQASSIMDSLTFGHENFV